MSSSSTAALEYNTNGELTIKNRQNESTGNSLKFKTSNSVTGNDKLIEIKQNNNSRLSIDEVGTGAIRIERNPADPEDLTYSNIKIESNTESKPSSSDLNHDLTVSPFGVSLGTSVYSKDDNGDIQTTHSKYIIINSKNNQDGIIEIQNNKYQLDGDKFKLNNQNEFIKDSNTYMTLGVSDLQLGSYKEKVNDIPSKQSFIKSSPGDIALYAGNTVMELNNDNGFSIENVTSADFIIKNSDFTIRTFKKGSNPAIPTLKIDCTTDTSSTQNLMEMTKEAVTIPKLKFGTNNTIITGVATSGVTPSNVDQTLPTIGYVKNLIPNIRAASDFYLQTSKDDAHIFYIAYRYGRDTDKKVYGLKVTFDGNNTSTVTGFVGTINDEGSIIESTASG